MKRKNRGTVSILKTDGISITVVRKAVKNMYLRVLPPDSRVQITAPKYTDEERILRFVSAKRDWIRKHQRLIAERPQRPERRYVTGEKLALWGTEYLLEVREAKRSDCVLQDRKVVLYVKPDASEEKRRELVERWYRRLLSERIEEILPSCEKRVGVCVCEWRIRRMKTRWGTCNPSASRIWLNLSLAEKPEECLVYVLVHELAHRLEPSHNKRFYALMDRFYPGWKEVRKRLNS